MINSEQLYDAHCHLDFADNAKDVARASADAGIDAISSTVVPASFVTDVAEFEQFENIHVALGMHPWWIADGRIGEVNIARFEQLSRETPLIGEIGLDFHGKRATSRAKQKDILFRLLEACNAPDSETDFPHKTIFLHSVKATSELLDMLEKMGSFDLHTCVFHWFSGSRDEFGRALADGAMFSVGMRMMATPHGREIAAAVPDECLLAETDNPPHEGMPWSADIWRQELEETYRSLAEIRGVDASEIVRIVNANSGRILSL